MAQQPSPLVPSSVLSQPAWAQAFRAWHKAQKFGADVEKIIQNHNPMPATWKVFLRSAEAQKCLLLQDQHTTITAVLAPTTALPASATLPDAAPASATPTAPHEAPQSISVEIPISQSQKIKMSKKPCPKCKGLMTLEEAAYGFLVCTSCAPQTSCEKCGKKLHADDSARAIKLCPQCKYCVPPELNAPSSPVMTPPEPALSAAEQGLLHMLAQGLKSVGFEPDKAMTAERVETIAFEQASAVVEMVIDDLEKQGKLGTKRQVIQIQENGKPTREVEGRMPVWFPRLLKLAQCRLPALLVGPAGCGKTTAVRMLAEAMDLPFSRVSLSAGVDEGCLQGWLLPIAAGGTFTYVPSTVVTAYEHGGVVLLDELDAADANMLIILSAVLDNGQWHIPLRHEQPVLRKHEDFVVVGAANTWGHGASRKFVGAQQLDERTLSRFRMGQIACDYDEALERDLYDDRAVETGQMLRARCRSIADFGRDVSTRDIESASIKLAQFPIEECWFEYFADWNRDELKRVHAEVDHAAMTAVLQ